MTFRKDNAPHSGGNGGREKQGQSTSPDDTASRPDPLLGWFRLGASVKPKVRRYGKSSASQQRDHHAIARQHESAPASGPLYLPKIRGGRHEE
jgi:hypothetical protein